jgi:hypothetical protein
VGRIRSWEPEEILAKLERDLGPVAPRIIREFEQRLDTKYSDSAVTIQWRGSKERRDRRAALWPSIKYGRIFYRAPICFRVDGKIEITFYDAAGKVPPGWNSPHDHKTIRTPFAEEEKLRELRDRVDALPGVSLKPFNPNGRWSTFDLLVLEWEETFDKLVEVFDWYVKEIIKGSAKLPSRGIEAQIRSDLDSLEAEEAYFEGTKTKRFVNHYERDDKLRAAAVEHHGVKCKVCGFDFEEVYGERGRDFIEAHHLIPVSSLGKETKVDPKRDMTVLCSNCHRMIHLRKDRILTPEELKNALRKSFDDWIS